MNCANCGRENPEEASFCSNCGNPLGLVCDNCGHRNTPDSSFCSKCGNRLQQRAPADAAPPLAYTPPHLAAKILRERERLAGERRTVTVLFVDAVGSTRIGERVDEELLYRLIQGSIERMMDSVHRYEGTVVQFRGDGIMALFGAPIAHEDSAVRAVTASLEMQRSLSDYSEQTEREHDVTLQFRVGLNTGPVVVGSIGDDLEMDYTAIGDTSNLAARMEQIAEPRTVYLTENTRRAAADYFELESLGPREIKGKSAPVEVYRAVSERAVRTRLDAAAARGLTPFVGRSHELSVLNGYYEQASRGNGQVVLISGEAGIGKSRLVREFRDSLSEATRSMTGQCISYGRNIPYLPVIDLLKKNFGIEELDDDGTIIRKVDERAASWNPAAQKTVPYLKFLLNVDPGDATVSEMDPFLRQIQIQDGLRSLLHDETGQGPLVLVIEDLHWIDEKSEQALESLVDIAGTLPVLVILTARPGYFWRFGERTFTSRIALGSLPPEQSASMARNVLGSVDLPEDLQQLIIAKAEGNPFFVEEVTKALVETGLVGRVDGIYRLTRPLEEVRIPDTIQEVILSRIDRLQREAKESIQLASVIGREFTVRLLERISDVTERLDGVLAELKKLELIYEKAYFPELSYMFKHALTHDVAYGTLLVERRTALHRMVAAAIEELYADRLAEHLETLASHYYQGQQWDKALEYQVLAGEKSQAAYANQDAIGYFDRALDVCRKLSDVPTETYERILSGKIDVYVTIGDPGSAVSAARQLVEIARERGARRVEGLAMGQVAFSELLAHRFDNAEAAATEALGIADSLGDGAVRTGGTFALSMLNALRGNISISREQFAEVLRLSRDNELPFYEVFAVEIPGLMDEWEGRYDPGNPLLIEAVEIAERHHQTFQLLEALWIQGLNLGAGGRYTQALEQLHETLDLCIRVQDIFMRARILNSIGWIHSELYDPESGLEWNQKGLELAIQMGDDEIIANARVNIADCYELLGRRGEARAELEDLYANLPNYHEWMKWRYSQHIIHSLGEVVLAEDDAPRALRLADECLALALPSNARKNIVKGRRLKGQTLAAQGHTDAAETELRSALAVAEEIGNPPQLWKTLVALGDLLEADRRTKEANDAYRRAVAVIDGIALELNDPELREAFATSSQVQELRQKT